MFFCLCVCPLACGDNRKGRKTAQEQDTDGKHDECDHVKKGSEPKSNEAESLNI
jgi:hypothetical protein